MEVSSSIYMPAYVYQRMDSRVEYRPLEGFVLAVSPFNFTAIGGNLNGGTHILSLDENSF